MWVNTDIEREPMARHLLLVEDDREIAALVALHLRDIHCATDIAGSGHDALTRYARSRYDLVILDLMLPDLDGLTVCQRLRAGGGDYIPILMLTAKSSELDRVLGLELGADDYLVKPFSFPELLARVKALLRRAEALRNLNGTSPDDTLTCGPLVIEVNQRRAILAGRELALTAKEFDLLLHFARQPGRVFSRSQLLDQIWGYSHEGYEHTVNSHINRLRAKLEPNPAEPCYLLTVWGVGYKFSESC